MNRAIAVSSLAAGLSVVGVVAFSNPTTFTDLNSIPGEICLGGLKVDVAGNVYASAPGGIRIFSPLGKHLGTIAIPELPANFTFGDADGRTLYMTARTGLYRIRTNLGGIRCARVDPPAGETQQLTNLNRAGVDSLPR